MHNPNVIRANIMGGSVPRMHKHKTILLSNSGRTPPNRCTQQQQHPQQRPCNAYYPPGGTIGNNHPFRTVWQNATGQWHLPPASNHGHAGVSTRPRNEDERWTVLAGRQKYAGDANGPPAIGETHVNEPLCPQPAAQPDAGVFLTGRGR
jgi:hypothetical protein